MNPQFCAECGARFEGGVSFSGGGGGCGHPLGGHPTGESPTPLPHQQTWGFPHPAPRTGSSPAHASGRDHTPRPPTAPYGAYPPPGPPPPASPGLTATRVLFGVAAAALLVPRFFDGLLLFSHDDEPGDGTTASSQEVAPDGDPVVRSGVYSLVTGRTYAMSCDAQPDSAVSCSGGDNAGVVLFAR